MGVIKIKSIDIMKIQSFSKLVLSALLVAALSFMFRQNVTAGNRPNQPGMTGQEYRTAYQSNTASDAIQNEDRSPAGGSDGRHGQ